MSRLNFSACNRLKKQKDFTYCYTYGKKLYTSSFVVFVCKNENTGLPWRLGMAVGKKVGKAVSRNRLRRLIRECFRLNQSYVLPEYDFIVVPKRSIRPTVFCLAAIKDELLPILRRISIG